MKQDLFLIFFKVFKPFNWLILIIQKYSIIIESMRKKIPTILLELAIIFIISFIFFALFEFKNTMPLFSGEDSFYHVGMAKYIANHGITQTFPFLQFTTINAKFVDHQLLFHLLLIPFIKLFGENIGPKLMDVFFISMAFSCLFLIFRYYKLKLASLYALMTLLVMPCDFYFRMAFIRVQGVALFLMTLSYYFILKNNSIALLITSFLFVWLYGGSVFLPVLILMYIIAKVLSGEKIDWHIPFYGIAGFILGIVINPYFPKNISFLYSQIFQTGIGAKLYSGGEWRPYDTWYWATISIVPIVIFFGSLVLSLAKNIKIDAKKITLVLFSFFLLLLQWKSKRFVEYWPFFATATGILVIGQLFEAYLNSIKQDVKIFGFFIAIAILLSIVLLKSNIEISKGYNDTKTPINIDTTKQVSDYLIRYSDPGQIVFTDDWDVFPFYFFFNQKNYYIVGLDPEFMNQYSHTLYEEFARISSGKDSTDLERIKNDFQASWVLIGSDHPEFKYNLQNRPDLFDLVFQNKDYYLFNIK